MQGNLLRSAPAQPWSKSMVLRPEKNGADAVNRETIPGTWTSREGAALSDNSPRTADQ